MTAELQELLARVEKAEGPDRAIDRDLINVLGLDWHRGAWWRTADPLQPWFSGWVKADVTASLDAALALVERLAMPEPDFDICFRQLGHFEVRWYMPERGHWRVASAKTPALALLAALLRALIAQTEAEPA
jgi:hypothetical protein